MIGGDGINDESNKTAPAPLRGVTFSETRSLSLLSLVEIPSMRFEASVLWMRATATSVPNISGLIVVCML